MPDDSTTLEKQCYKCGNWYPRNPEYWHKQSKNKDGLRNYCKDCACKGYQQYWKVHADEYREISKIRAKEWQAANPERKRANEKRWQSENKERVRIKQREWRQNHRDSERQRGKRYRENNHERELARKDLFRKDNMHLWRKYAQQRRARKLGAGGSHTPEEVHALFEQQYGKCFHCNRDISNRYEEDHWTPISRGGSDDIGNIRLLCMPCNRSKGNKLPSEWCPERYSD